MIKYARSLIACAAALLAPHVGFAQTPADAQSVAESRRQLDQLKADVARQMNLIEAIQARLDSMAPAKPAAEPSIEQQLPPSATTQVSVATTNYETFAQDPQAAPRLDNAPIDPKFPGFFRLPGTGTYLKIGGYFKTDFIYDGKPAGDPERFIPSSFPFGQPSVNNTTVSIRPTRINLDFRVPVNSLGDVRFFVEADFFGSNSTSPRLRHAYTQVKNFLIGQTFSNFQDPDAGPDGLDFQGPNAQVSIRNPQIRYTFGLGEKSSLALSVEKASSDIAFKTPEFNALPNSPAPDGAIKYRHEYGGGHIQVAGLFRSISAYLPNGKSDSVFGWGAMMAGAQKFGERDTFTYQMAYGQGIERYLNDTSGLGIDAAPVSTHEPHLRALPVIAPYFGYQHYWARKVRSSVIYGFDQVTNTPYEPLTTYHKSHYMAGNLIWNPFGSLNLGAEYLYAWARRKDDSSVNAPRIMFSAKYDLNFARKPD